MARKFKTYQTSLGFFDLAIAAPSMKAALQAWGAGSNLFHQGIAKQTNEPAVVAATMAKPGVVLKRPVGSSGPFTEHPEMSKHLLDRQPKKTKAHITQKKQPLRSNDANTLRKAALAFEKEQRQRERQRRKEEAATEKENDRRQRARAKAKGVMENAEREHEKRAGKIATERAALEERSQAEDARWEKQRRKLDIALRRLS
jgi:colicin import membrane protein